MMARNESKEVVIEATPEEIIDAIADPASLTELSGAIQSVEILDRTDDGRPRTLKIKVKVAGLTDEMVVEYTWADDVVSWVMVSGKLQRSHDGRYTLTPEGDKTRVRFDIKIDPLVPLPGFVVSRVARGVVDAATDGLRKRVLSVKKGR